MGTRTLTPVALTGAGPRPGTRARGTGTTSLSWVCPSPSTSGGPCGRGATITPAGSLPSSTPSPPLFPGYSFYVEIGRGWRVWAHSYCRGYWPKHTSSLLNSEKRDGGMESPTRMDWSPWKKERETIFPVTLPVPESHMVLVAGFRVEGRSETHYFSRTLLESYRTIWRPPYVFFRP